MNAGLPSSGTETATMVRLSDQLTTSLRELLRSSPWEGLGPIELARTLGVDKTLTSRLLTALRAHDPLVGLSSLPGTGPLRQFTRAARRHGADSRAAQAAEREIDGFDRELQRTFGTRTRLDAVIADALPESRRRHLEGARQAVYRGMALIKGVSVDLASITWLVHPSRDNPDRADVQVLAAFVGIRRLRPTARVRLASNHRKSRPTATLLTDFCRPDDLSIGVSRDGTFTFYEISTGSVHRDAAADVYLTESLPEAVARARPAEQGGPFILGDSVAYAYKRLALNLLMHRDAWPGARFSLRAYDTSTRGMVNPPDPAREIDRIPVDDTLHSGPVTTESLRANAVPGYYDVLRHIAPEWDLSAFRALTCELVYPMYGAQALLMYESD